MDKKLITILSLLLLPECSTPPVSVDAGTDATADSPDVPAGSCTDSVQNGMETDRDCGGRCPGCATGQMCLVNADCRSNVCGANLVCSP